MNRLRPLTGAPSLLRFSTMQGIGSEGSAEGATAVSDLTDQKQFEGWDFTDIWRISQSQNRPVLQANAEDNALSGTGKQEDPYKIYRAIDLKNFRDLVNDENGQTADTDAHAKLMNNIDLNGNELDQWTPIGNSSNEYSGTFNGDGHTISGLYINNSTANDQGLFGYVGTGGTVQNLSVSGSVSGYWYVGGVVGYNGGSVENCYNTGAVSGSGLYVGGVVGDNRDTVENCYNIGKVSGTGVGGVVGWNFGGTVKNCYNIGEVSGPDSVGGVVGENRGGSTVENCYNTSKVSGIRIVDGVVGWNDSGTVKNCYNTGKVSGPDSGSGNSVGGVVGLNSGPVKNCYNTGTVTGTDDYVGGVHRH